MANRILCGTRLLDHVGEFNVYKSNKLLDHIIIDWIIYMKRGHFIERGSCGAP